MAQPTVDSLVDDLRLAGLEVVEGNQWRARGAFPIDEATQVRTVRSYGPGDQSLGDAVREAVEAAASLLVDRSGRVWLLGQANDHGQVTVVLAVPDGLRPTVSQRDAADAVLAVLDVLAFDAPVIGDPEGDETDPDT
jgi:hypothetical protein